ncbi:MAG: N-acetylmuramoyl-L-alanine amidase [Cyanobacteria bacterium P01_H01_bin.119]
MHQLLSRRLAPALLGMVGGLLMALPVDAAVLQFWRFDNQQNRLIFSTDSGVQPRAQLIFNPTRVVIDLPGTTLNRPTVNQPVGGAIRQIRVGQFDANTTRLVIEYNPGYTVDPQQVQVRGETTRQWVVQLPEPQPASQASPSQPNEPAENSVTAVPNLAAPTQIDGILATSEGFFVRTSGELPEVNVDEIEQDGDRRIQIELPNTAISRFLTPQSLPVNRYSVDRWQVEQVETAPPRTRITMHLGEDSPLWRAAASPSLNGVIILPPLGVPIASVPDQPRVSDGSDGTEAIAVPPANPDLPPTAPPSFPAVPNNSQLVVVIDPGHGGRDPGAIGIGGLQEKGVVLSISRQVAAILAQQGVQVVMTRDSDYFIDLDPRVQLAERVNADLFVSIHANAISLSRPDVNGFETYYYSDAGLRLARTIHNAVLQIVSHRDRGVRRARFYVLRNTSMPAVLVETGFVTGAVDAPNLNNPAWQQQMASGIAQGILQYIQQNNLAAR